MDFSWEVVQNVSQSCSAVIAVPLNTLLIYLIVNHSPKEIGAYRYLMIYISVFETVYALLDVVVSPFAHSYGSTFIVLVNMNHTTIPNCSYKSFSIWCGFYGSSMAVFGIHFVYRYLVATGSALLKTFQSWMIVLWLSIPVEIGTTWTVLTYWPCAPREATDRYVGANINETLHLALDEVEYISPYFYELGENDELVIYWPSFVGIGINSCIINASIFTIVYFGYKCYKILNSLVPKTSTSEKNRQLQKQLYLALVTQTLIPLVLMHIPVSVLYFCSFASVELGPLSGIAPASIALYIILDPLPTMFIIGQYRLILYKWLIWIPTKLNCKKPVQPESVEMTENVPNSTGIDSNSNNPLSS
ncbi:Protein CBR-STR-204 [Caenorhabditis briggsae]|uniref:Serpentine receptor class r-10 n=1 Tax=Caenorhabditis briggsae TaxID=6238 RepID=A8XUA7_CAEBR|nr:Protein CBR-STR-204 [Caenorhabditis briggsae]CAP36232.1 Protein CBR-STR-204 [Caenorhabditis briggsae]